MVTKYCQISLKDTFSDCKNMFMDDVPSFFQLLEQHFDVSLFIPQTFYNAFYQYLGCKRDCPLIGFLFAHILQKIFSISTVSLLIILLTLWKKLRDFYDFTKIPNAPLFTCFKLGFANHIELIFHHMVDYTETICQQIDSYLAQIVTFDTSSIELYITENNPKTLNALIRKLRAYYKDNPNVGCRSTIRWLTNLCLHTPLPSRMQSSTWTFICYVDKFAILSNHLSIIQHIAFLDDDFKAAHSKMTIEKKSDSPDEDKSIGDATSLKPVLADFF